MISKEEQANDAVKMAPHLHHVLFENDKIRVLKVNITPGDKAEMHWHPENMNYVLSSGKLRFTKPDGSTVEATLNNEQVTFSGPGSHVVENIGDLEVQTVQVGSRYRTENSATQCIVTLTVGG